MATVSSSACADDAHAASGDPDDSQQSSPLTSILGAIVERAAACPDRLRTRLPSFARACPVQRTACATCPVLYRSVGPTARSAASSACCQCRRGCGRRPLDLACLLRQTGNASGGVGRTAPPIRHWRASLLAADPDWGCRARYERRRAHRNHHRRRRRFPREPSTDGGHNPAGTGSSAAIPPALAPAPRLITVRLKPDTTTTLRRRRTTLCRRRTTLGRRRTRLRR